MYVQVHFLTDKTSIKGSRCVICQWPFGALLDRCFLLWGGRGDVVCVNLLKRRYRVRALAVGVY